MKTKSKKPMKAKMSSKNGYKLAMFRGAMK